MPRKSKYTNYRLPVHDAGWVEVRNELAELVQRIEDALQSDTETEAALGALSEWQRAVIASANAEIWANGNPFTEQ